MDIYDFTIKGSGEILFSHDTANGMGGNIMPGDVVNLNVSHKSGGRTDMWYAVVERMRKEASKGRYTVILIEQEREDWGKR